MAPEMAAGQAYDLSSDIFGLGKTLERIVEFCNAEYNLCFCFEFLGQCLDRPPPRPSPRHAALNNSLLLTAQSHRMRMHGAVSWCTPSVPRGPRVSPGCRISAAQCQAGHGLLGEDRTHVGVSWPATLHGVNR